MKQLIKQYLDRGISRRNFLSSLGAFGFTSVAANSMARSLAPFLPPAGDGSEESMPSWMREMRGTGGALLVAQLKAAGIEHIFFNPGSGAVSVYDALVDEPNMHLIQALHESSLAAMANGYAKASGKTPFVICAPPGFPSIMVQMYNNWKDQTPMVVAVDYVNHASMGQDAAGQYTDHMEEISQPITKWHWVAETTEKIPEITRRAIKFASTPPCGPVFLAFPEDTLQEEGKALIMDQAKFSVPMKIHSDPPLVEKAARLLLEARNPLLYVGDEIVWCRAQKEVVELAELLGLPVTQNMSNIGYIGWSKPFPTQHPLFLGGYFAERRYPGEVDVMLNLGSRMPSTGSQWKMSLKTKLIEVRLDPTNLAREYPTEVAMVSDVQLAITDLLAAVRGMATAAKLKQIRESRTSKTAEYTAQMRAFHLAIARSRWEDGPLVTVERMGLEMEEVIDKDACIVMDGDAPLRLQNLMAFGGADKQFFWATGGVLGSGLPASFGVKLARPDLPVVAMVSDGSFQFSGPQPLWSFARYRAPVIIIVLNNRSYNDERNRMWITGGKQFQEGRDMGCYLGDPDMDFAKIASGYGVEGEVVAEASSFKSALERAKRATADGRPYLLDVLLERTGIGASSTWHPAYSIAALRQRKV